MRVLDNQQENAVTLMFTTDGCEEGTAQIARPGGELSIGPNQTAWFDWVHRTSEEKEAILSDPAAEAEFLEFFRPFILSECAEKGI